MLEVWNKITNRLAALPSPDIYTFFRVWIAKVFYDSGRTKVGDGFFETSEITIMLFEEEYALPLLSPEFAAKTAIYAETIFPILLFLGLATRFSAFALLGMTAVIQFFVYPTSWTDHLLWSVVLLALVMRGGGQFSLDAMIAKKTN